MLNLDLQNYEVLGTVLSKVTPRQIAFVAKNKNIDIPTVGGNVEYR